LVILDIINYVGERERERREKERRERTRPYMANKLVN